MIASQATGHVNQLPGGDILRAADLARKWAFLAAIGLLLALLVLGNSPIHDKPVGYFFDSQDRPVALGMIVALSAMAWWSGGAVATRFVPSRWMRPLPAPVGVVACLIVFIGIVGHFIVMQGYALSRDEQLTLFDAEIYRTGHFAARIPPAWREYFDTLNPLYIAEQLHGAGWVSTYRPINALLHALGGMAGNPAITNPVLTAIGFAATWRVAMHALPGDAESQFVALLLYATST